MNLHVGRASAVGALTVCPVWNGAGAGRRGYVTSSRHLGVTECADGPTVSRLLATNSGSKDVLVLDGQLFEGGWQHRMAVRSCLVGAGRSELVDVACVEQRRWRGSEGHTLRGRRASTVVREGHDGRAGSQYEVWRRVARTTGSANGTGSLVDHVDRLEQEVRVLVDQVRPLGGQTGVLIGLAGQPLLLEDFDHPLTLAEQLRPILLAAALDAVGRPAVAMPGRRARRFIERVEHAARARGRAETGRPVMESVRTDDIDLKSLSRGGSRVHLRATFRRHPVLVEA